MPRHPPREPVAAALEVVAVAQPQQLLLVLAAAPEEASVEARPLLEPSHCSRGRQRKSQP